MATKTESNGECGLFPQTTLALAQRWLALCLFFELTLDGVVVGRSRLAGIARRGARTGTRAVDLLADAEHRLLQLVLRGADAVHIVGAEGGAHVADLRLDLGLEVRRNPVAQVAQRLLGGVGGVV